MPFATRLLCQLSSAGGGFGHGSRTRPRRAHLAADLRSLPHVDRQPDSAGGSAMSGWHWLRAASGRRLCPIRAQGFGASSVRHPGGWHRNPCPRASPAPCISLIGGTSCWRAGTVMSGRPGRTRSGWAKPVSDRVRRSISEVLAANSAMSPIISRHTSFRPRVWAADIGHKRPAESNA